MSAKKKTLKQTEVQMLQTKVRKLQRELRAEKHYNAVAYELLKPAQDAWRDEFGPAAVASTPTMSTLIEWLMNKYDELRTHQSLDDLHMEQLHSNAGNDPSDSTDGPHGSFDEGSDFDSATQGESIEEVVAKNEEGAKEFLADQAELNAEEPEPVHNDSN